MVPIPTNNNGKVAIVTGASAGIGLETVRALAHHASYSHIVLAVRNVRKMEIALAMSHFEPTAISKCVVIQVDMASFDSVYQFVATFQKCEFRRLDRLVLNAGINAYTNLERQNTVDSMDEIWQVNFLSNFYLVGLLTPLLRSTKASRIICLSSVMHWFGLPTAIYSSLTQKGQMANAKPLGKYSTYADTKMAMTIFAHQLNQRGISQGIAVNPGGVASDIFRVWFQIPILGALLHLIFRFILLTCSDGAKTSVYACTGYSGKGFAYLSPYGQTIGKGSLKALLTDMYWFRVNSNPKRFIGECAQVAIDQTVGASVWNRALEILTHLEPPGIDIVEKNMSN